MDENDPAPRMRQVTDKLSIIDTGDYSASGAFPRDEDVFLMPPQPQRVRSARSALAEAASGPSGGRSSKRKPTPAGGQDKRKNDRSLGNSSEDEMEVDLSKYVTVEAYEALIRRVELLQSSYEHLQERQAETMGEMCNSISRLEGGQIEMQTAINRSEELITNAGGRVAMMEHSIRELKQANSSTTSWKASMEASLRGMKEQLIRAPREDTNEASQDKDTNSSFFIGGMYTLRDWYGDARADPAEIINVILREVHMYCSAERLVTADNDAREKGNRMAARAMIVVMRNPSKKKEAIIQIKKWLAREGITRGVTVMDCFPNNVRETARALGKFSVDKRREGQFQQYRILNREGAAVLQIKPKGKGEIYRDEIVSEEQLSSYRQSSTHINIQAMEMEQEDQTSNQRDQQSTSQSVAAPPTSRSLGAVSRPSRTTTPTGNPTPRTTATSRPSTPNNNQPARTTSRPSRPVTPLYSSQPTRFAGPVVSQPRGYYKQSAATYHSYQPIHRNQEMHQMHMYQPQLHQPQMGHQQQHYYSHQPEHMVYTVNQQYPYTMPRNG